MTTTEYTPEQQEALRELTWAIQQPPAIRAPVLNRLLNEHRFLLSTKIYQDFAYGPYLYFRN